MAETHYAWSPIHYHEGEGKETKKKIKHPGETVTKEELNLDDDGWDDLIKIGSVRKTKWPEDLDPRNPNALSPNEHRLRKLRLEREALDEELRGLGADMPSNDSTEGEHLDEDDGA